MHARKRIVLLLILAVLLVANAHDVARHLEETGLIELARTIQKEHLTGTALTVIAALLILLPDRHPHRAQPPPAQ